jgi:inosine-uridine nucleoside N-ribohydrolase
LTRFLIAVLTTVGLAAGQAARVPAEAAPAAEPWIIDSDVGFDDWVAIMLMAASPGEVNLKGVAASGNGLSTCKGAGRNALTVLKLLGRDTEVKVACGADYPLDGYHTYPGAWRTDPLFGADTMGGLLAAEHWGGKPYPPSSGSLATATGQTLNASTKLLVDTLSAHDSVNILALGPFTNLAWVLLARPDLKRKIKQIVSMAGAVDVKGNIRVHNSPSERVPNFISEWNAYIDPVAARIVFASGVPIKLVPLDVTDKVPLTESFKKDFSSIDRWSKETPDRTPGTHFLVELFKGRTPETGEFYHWDPLAAAIAIQPSLCARWESRKLEVISEETDDRHPVFLESDAHLASFPPRNAFFAPRSVLKAETAGATIISPDGTPVSVCLNTDPARYESFVKVRMTGK